MPDIKKPIATLELASAAVTLVKTAAVVFVMMMLEWARLKQKQAEVGALKAQNDLEVEKLKSTGVSDAKSQIDSYLGTHGLPPGNPGESSGPKV